MDSEQLRQAFNDFYDFLSVISDKANDTLWFDTGTTAHEALIDLAAKHDKATAEELEKRLKRDCDFTEAE